MAEVFHIAAVGEDSAALSTVLGSASTVGATGSPVIPVGPLADPARMRDAGYCDSTEIDRLWAQKTRIDKLFDEGDSTLYWRAREELFPAAPRRRQKRRKTQGEGSGLEEGHNRASEKLAEIIDAAGGFDMGAGRQQPPNESVFLDICGAPGAWSNHLYVLGKKAGIRMRGYGFSLRGGTNPLSCTWYADLTGRDDFTALYGADGTGDVCVKENIAEVVAAVGRTAGVVLADGACGVGSNWGGDHLENYQEIIVGRMVLSELLIMLETIRSEGSFVCKIFDTFSHLTAGVIFVCAALFEKAVIVKPKTSRIVNSERYLVCKNFLGSNRQCLDLFVNAVRAAHSSWPAPTEVGPWSGLAPLTVLPAGFDIAADLDFHASVRHMATTLCTKQAVALEKVVDRALLLRRDAPPDAKRQRSSAAHGDTRGLASEHSRVVASVRPFEH